MSLSAARRLLSRKRLRQLFGGDRALLRRVRADRQLLAPLFAAVITIGSVKMALLSPFPAAWGYVVMAGLSSGWILFRRGRNQVAAYLAVAASLVPPAAGLSNVLPMAPAPVEAIWMVIAIGLAALMLPFRVYLLIGFGLLVSLGALFATNEAIPYQIALHVWMLIALSTLLVGIFAATNELQHIHQVRENMTLKSLEESLRTLTEMLVKAEGQESSRSLTRHLTHVLEVDWAVVALFSPDGTEWEAVSYSRERNEWKETVVPRGETLFDRAAGTEAWSTNELDGFEQDPWIVDREVGSVLFVPIQDARGALLGVLGACAKAKRRSTIHERWLLRVVAVRIGMELDRAEKEWLLRESERRYRIMFDAAEDLIVAHDENGIILMANRSLKRFLGTERVEGTSIREFVDPDYRGKFSEYLSSMRESHRSTGFLAVRDGRGRKRILEYRNRLTKLPEGGTIVLGAARDVTERLERDRLERAKNKMLHDQLEKREEDLALRQMFFAHLSDLIPVGLLQLDSTGLCMYANRFLGEMSGIEPAEMLGTGWRQLFGDEISDELIELQEATEEEQVIQIEVLLEGGRNQIPVLCRTERVEDESGYSAPRYWTITDLSEIRKKDEMLNRTRRMSELGTLVGRIAHEVRNPLFGLTSVIDLLELKSDQDAQLARYAPMLRSETDRLSQLMSDLLDFGRPLELHIGELDLGLVLERAIAHARRRFPTVEVETSFSNGRLLVAGDNMALLQVLENILDNAAYYTGEGKIFVETETVDGTIGVVVRDTGPGFSDSAAESLFEPFFTERKGGTGLGMAIVKRIVDEHGGSITHANHPDGGGIIRLRLPSSGS